ncbi:unnamed protein product [Haemonchus placei]|uniref:CRAL-TRIO domain-containing protein n=1 Tax=Haemonchus placei TaxID=6290 RepID=A0A158QQ79_HAEPC|nr:unnamed protein product [Haemonchus placei]
MPPNAPAELDANVVAQVRAQVADLLHPRYDTHFNILRWLQSCEFNIPKTVHNLRKHLKWRKERHLDEDARGLQSCPITAEYAPVSIIGPNRKNGDRLIVVDQSGKLDIRGVMNSIQPTQYLHQLFRNFEKILTMLNEMEARTGVQCSIYYVFDLEGLSFDPTLLGILSGPFRVSWQLIGQHYREFINQFVVINTPSYINVLWTAISPFIPENARSRVVITGKDWPQEILELADPDCLPERYGGEIPDEKILKDPKPVPKDLYWRPKPGYPSVTSLHRISIPAGKTRTLTYHVTAGTDLLVYSQNDSDVTFGMYYTEKEEAPEEERDILVPPTQKCGLPAVDFLDQHVELSGYFHISLSNDAAWLFPTTYKMIVMDRSGKEIKAINQKEKWIKQGSKQK